MTVGIAPLAVVPGKAVHGRRGRVAHQPPERQPRLPPVHRRNLPTGEVLVHVSIQVELPSCDQPQDGKARHGLGDGSRLEERRLRRRQRALDVGQAPGPSLGELASADHRQAQGGGARLGKAVRQSLEHGAYSN